MARITQTESGKAWEYGLARQLADMLNRGATLIFDAPRLKSQNAYNLLSRRERRKIDRAANEAAVFLLAHDARLLKTRRVIIQSDMAGIDGDVRDIVIETDDEAVGVSAKHRHNALKHSRLSDSIDFGDGWYGVSCSPRYWKKIVPIFGDLRRRAGQGQVWSSLPNKKDDYYLPVLHAFMEEVRENADPGKLMRYLLGRHDFYKIIKENGNVSLQSFNIDGTLEWGSKIGLPDAVIQFGMKPRSKTTAILHLSRGWQVSFRIHSAESKIIPSLKFDIRLEGSPETLSRHEIPYGRHSI